LESEIVELKKQLSETRTRSPSSSSGFEVLPPPPLPVGAGDLPTLLSDLPPPVDLQPPSDEEDED